MRTYSRIPTVLALALVLAIPTLAQSAKEQHAAPAAPAAAAAAPQAAKAAPAVDPAKADLLRQEYVAKTAELRGKITARQAELETVLATKPGDEAAVKKLVAEISTLRGQLFEQTTLFRIRFAKETGMPMHMTRAFGRMGGQGGMMMDGQGMECMMGGKGMMSMDKQGMGMGMGMGKGMMMDHGAMGASMPKGHDMPQGGHDMPAGQPMTDDAAKAPAAQ